MTDKDRIVRVSGHTPWEPVFGYSRAVRVGNLIAVSGTTATDESGTIIGINQMYVQARQAIQNLSRALEKAGAGLKDVIRTRVFVTDISRFDDVARAHREAFGDAPPAASAVEVRRLVHPDMLVEIEADAIVRNSAKPTSISDSKTEVLRGKAGAARRKKVTKAKSGKGKASGVKRRRGR